MIEEWEKFDMGSYFPTRGILTDKTMHTYSNGYRGT